MPRKLMTEETLPCDEKPEEPKTVADILKKQYNERKAVPLKEKLAQALAALENK